MNKKLFPALGLPLMLACKPAPCDISAMVATGEWFSPPNALLEAVKPSPQPPGSFSAIIEAWSGGAYDTKRDRLIIWGGGHSDYAGNEIYAFSVNSMTWSRASDPSANVGGDEASGLYPDGKPRSEHSYDHIVYVPSIDRFCSFGAGGTYPGGQIGHSKTMCFDFDTKTWEQKANTPNAATSAIAEYDPATQKVWMHGTLDRSFLAAWDPVKDAWTKYAAMDGGMEYYHTAAIGNGKMLALGAGELLQWDLANPSKPPTKLATTGAREIESAQSPGFVYASKSGYFVAWNGGAALYALNLASKAWTKVMPTGSNKVVPTAADPRGTYGRFRYIPSQDAFIGVNAVDQSVFITRLPASLPVIVRPGNGGPQGMNLRIELPYLTGRLSRPLSASPAMQPFSLVLRTLDSRVVWRGTARNAGDGLLRLDSQDGLSVLPPAEYLLSATGNGGERTGGRFCKP